MTDRALIVVDVQNGFVTEHSAPAVPAIARLLQAWKSTGEDLVFTRYLNFNDSPFERIMGWSKLKESPEIDIVDELQGAIEAATAVVDKRIYTLFTDEGAALAEKRGWREIYVCGIDTEVCVLKTAVDAFERNITPWVVADASASHSGQAAHEAGLLVAGKMIGRRQIVTIGDLLAHNSSTTG